MNLVNAEPTGLCRIVKQVTVGALLLLVAFVPTGYTLAASSRQAASNPLRTYQRIDDGWRFQRDASKAPTIAGPVVSSWRWMATDKEKPDAAMVDPTLDASGGNWKDAKSGDDVFVGRAGFAWFRAGLDAVAGGNRPRRIHFESVDDNATIYLNGKLLGSHAGWDEAFDINVATAWLDGGPNVLAVLVENTAGIGGIGPVVLASADISAPMQAAPTVDASTWEEVHLPHDFVVEHTFDPKADGSHGFLPSGAAWYRKTIQIPAAAKGRRVWLDFDGVYRDSRVWLNGQLLGRHECGYSSFQYDISAVAKYGAANQIVVHVDARRPEGWWYEGGGIYRHVYLGIAGSVSVARYGTLVTANVKGLQAGQTPSATLAIKTRLANATSKEAAAMVTSIVTRPDNSVAARVTSAVAVPPQGDIEISQTANEAKAQLWSLEKPQMYRLRTVVALAGKTVDSYDTPFGVRSIRFDAAQGFFLNEKPVKIKGTCNHQDFAGIGVALPDGILSWRVKKLKEMGSNAYRTSHNQVAKELLDACDNQGMLVMDEMRHFGDGEGGKASSRTRAEDHSNLREQVLRDRNHPSIILWSIGNEEGEQGSPNGLQIGTAMKSVINQLDGSRPVSEAINSRHEEGSATILDVLGVNYNPGHYAYHRTRHPGQPVYGSETASALSTRGVYTTDAFQGAGTTQRGDQAHGWVAAYDINRPSWGQTAEDAWRPIAEQPFNAGGFVWTGFDYRGEPTPFGWPDVNSAFGIMDMCGFPKDSYYYYQAVWGDKPMVHVFPHWNWAGKEGQPIDVWAYSNAERVELFLNGTSLGAKAMPQNGHLSWAVPYAPGTLTAKATSGGKLMATDEVVTTGAPAAIRLKADRPALIADGEDASPVAVEIVDANGRVVPTADNLVMFSVSGSAIVAGVGNGNPSSHEPDKASQRRAFNGLCMAVIRAAQKPGKVTITARAAGLKTATLRLDVARYQLHE